MRRSALLLSLSLVSALSFLSGCVPQDTYDTTLKSYKSLQEQLVRTEDERDAANANLGTLRSQLTSASKDILTLQQHNATLNAELEELAKNYDSLLRRVAELQLSPLPGDLQQALMDLAAAYPDLLSFDPRTGMLRFASDFTFDPGSVELKSGVRETISKLAAILNSEKARGFEVRVIGHTDTVRIGKPETLRQHPTNVHLSAHRAISVRDALVSSGTEPTRVMVAGYGEFRPVVANGPNGAAANRRVEIFLLPMPPTSTLPATGADVPLSSPQPKSRITEPMK